MSITVPCQGITVLAQPPVEREFRPRSTPLLGVQFDEDAGTPTRLLHEYAGQLVVLTSNSADDRAGTIAGVELFRHRTVGESRLRDMHRAALAMRGQVPHVDAEAWTDLDHRANTDDPSWRRAR